MSRPERPTTQARWDQSQPQWVANNIEYLVRLGTWAEDAERYMDAIEQENQRLRKALEDIMQHQVFVAGPLAVESATHRIAREAVEADHESV